MGSFNFPNSVVSYWHEIFEKEVNLMECSELNFKIITNIQRIAYGCPNCQKIFCRGYFVIELSCCGENKLVCDTGAGFGNCCQKTFPVPLVFDHRADVEKFIDDVKNGRITEVCLTSIKFVNKMT